MKERLFILFISLAVVSCVSTRSALKRYDLDTVERETVTQKFASDRSKLRSVSGKFDFSYSTESDRNQSSAYIFISADTLYFEIKGIVGETEAVLFLDKDSLKAVNYLEDIRIREKSGENSLRRVTGINMGVSDLRNSILGFADNEVSEIKRRESGALTVRVVEDSTKYSFVKVNENLSVTEVTEFNERELRYKKQYDYFTVKNGVVFPRRIRISSYNPPAKLTIFFTDLDINSFPETEK